MLADFSPKMVLQTFYAHEIENELRSRGIAFGIESKKVNCSSVKKKIERLRKEWLYPHDCGANGRARGYPYLHVMDGIWKINFRDCRMPVLVSAKEKQNKCYPFRLARLSSLLKSVLNPKVVK